MTVFQYNNEVLMVLCNAEDRFNNAGLDEK